MTRAMLRSNALALPPHERAALAAELLDSLDEPEGEQNIVAAWEAEIERRIVQIDRGEVETVPAEQVMRRLGRR